MAGYRSPVGHQETRAEVSPRMASLNLPEYFLPFLPWCPPHKSCLHPESLRDEI